MPGTEILLGNVYWHGVSFGRKIGSQWMLTAEMSDNTDITPLVYNETFGEEKAGSSEKQEWNFASLARPLCSGHDLYQ